MLISTLQSILKPIKDISILVLCISIITLCLMVGKIAYTFHASMKQQLNPKNTGGIICQTTDAIANLKETTNKLKKVIDNNDPDSPLSKFSNVCDTLDNTFKGEGFNNIMDNIRICSLRLNCILKKLNEEGIGKMILGGSPILGKLSSEELQTLNLLENIVHAKRFINGSIDSPSSALSEEEMSTLKSLLDKINKGTFTKVNSKNPQNAQNEIKVNTLKKRSEVPRNNIIPGKSSQYARSQSADSKKK